MTSFTQEPRIALLLDGSLGLTAAPALAASLRDARGHDLDISAVGVRYPGAQCGQLLVAAVNAWRMNGRSLRIVDATRAFDEGVRNLGLHLNLQTELSA